ncbi:hypothetical protein BGP_2590 [Beggiatoa sp. PS]|nr:hypothetical protein BGP_2590 [Beggiatoa sp. PS]
MSQHKDENRSTKNRLFGVFGKSTGLACKSSLGVGNSKFEEEETVVGVDVDVDVDVSGNSVIGVCPPSDGLNHNLLAKLDIASIQ